MSKIDEYKRFETLPKETQKLITDVMLTTMDMCNELSDGYSKIVFFEDVALRVMRAEILDHINKKEWFDVLGDRTWKKHGEVTSWDGKYPIRLVNNTHWKNPDELDEFDKPLVYWTANGKAGVFKDMKCLIGGKREGTLEEHKRHWQHKCEKYNIVKWCYQDEIAPVNIKNSNEA